MPAGTGDSLLGGLGTFPDCKPQFTSGSRQPVTFPSRGSSTIIIVPKIIHFLFLTLLLTPLWAIQQNGIVRSGGLAIPGATVTAMQAKQKTPPPTEEAAKKTFNTLPAGGGTPEGEIFVFPRASRGATTDKNPSPTGPARLAGEKPNISPWSFHTPAARLL